ncbi:unnamed protein product, partial [Adineta ricciae]
MTDKSLSILPNELFHHILKYLDTHFIIFTLRRVSKQFYDITNRYNGYLLDVNSMSSSHLKIISRIIRPESITALKFHDEPNQQSQIGLFFSIFNIDQLVSLKTIVVGDCFHSENYQHLQKLPIKNLASLHISYDRKYETYALPFISKVLSLPTLHQLHLIQSNFTLKDI